ncbi:hypothetical protein [Rufibacter radiotolerans]|uniref:hypothetical protein n=1 Tax=Rufibacter radiotolerans TaxID=1379910 RepID=UPI0018CCF950|nr:hypothetical protein [Rufibacter radiotolerans]
MRHLHRPSTFSLKGLLQSLALVCLAAWWMSACTPRDEEFTPDAGALLQFEADTVTFDTIFTEASSVTKRLKVYNRSKNAVRISEIKVGQLSASPFQVIVNGQAGPQLQNIEVRGGDSLLVLVTANLKSTSAQGPFLVNESLLFLTNGNQQEVKLVAYGQNATYYRNATAGCAEVWTAAKAHVIYDSVTVPVGCTLTIAKGAQVYLHNKAKLKVLGMLRVEGEPEQRVVFQQVRQEERYRNAPGQWHGLEFAGASQNNQIRYAEIKNAMTGVYLKAEGNNVPQVTLRQVFVKNMLQHGVLSHGGNVRLENTLIANCAEYALAGLGGGRYEVVYSTLANYSYDFLRVTPSFLFQEKLETGGKLVREAKYVVEVVNSILWGRQEEELKFDDAKLGSTRTVRYSFLKTKAYQTEFTGNGNQINVDPKFRDDPKLDFQIIKLSPANKAATPLAGITVDYENKARDAATPDVGAIEVHD